MINDSFIFHIDEWLHGMSKGSNDRTVWTMRIIDFVQYGDEPELSNVEGAFWNLIKKRIEDDQKKRRGGAPSGNNNASKERETTENKDVKQPKTMIENNSKQWVETTENNLKTTAEQPKTNNCNGNGNVNENEERDENKTDDLNHEKPLVEENPPTLSPPNDYYKQIYTRLVKINEALKANDKSPMRISKNDIAFLNYEMKLSARYLAGHHSDDVLRALDNFLQYASTPKEQLDRNFVPPNFENWCKCCLDEFSDEEWKLAWKLKAGVEVEKPIEWEWTCPHCEHVNNTKPPICLKCGKSKDVLPDDFFDGVDEMSLVDEFNKIKAKMRHSP